MALREVAYNGVDFGISYIKIPAKIAPKTDTQKTQDLQNAESKNIVFLHGWGSNKELMQNAFENVFLQYNHFYVDLPGFGKSPNEMLLNTNDYAKILSAFFAALEIVPHIVVGHSYGGKIAVLLQDAQELILLSSAGIPTKKPLKVQAKIALAKLAKMLHISLPFLRSKDAQNLNPIMYEVFKSIVNEDFREIFAKCEKKTSIFWGEIDSATPLESGKKIHSLIKNSKFFVCKGGHYFFLERTAGVIQTKLIEMVYNFMNQQDIQNPFIIAHIIAQGKVQGVGYRKFAKASADTLGIVGSTENLASGEVEIYAMCKREEIMLDFVNALWSGPARGEVQNLIINHIDIEAWEAQEKTILDFLGCDSASDLTQTISNAESSKIAKLNGFRERLQDFVILK